MTAKGVYVDISYSEVFSPLQKFKKWAHINKASDTSEPGNPFLSISDMRYMYTYN